MSTSRDPTPVRLFSSHSCSRALPSRPVAPITKTRMLILFVLSFPIVSNIRMIVREPALVLRVVIAVGEVDQLRGLGAKDFVPVTNSRRNQDFPGLELADIERIDQAESFRASAHVV